MVQQESTTSNGHSAGVVLDEGELSYLEQVFNSIVGEFQLYRVYNHLRDNCGDLPPTKPKWGLLATARGNMVSREAVKSIPGLFQNLVLNRPIKVTTAD